MWRTFMLISRLNAATTSDESPTRRSEPAPTIPQRLLRPPTQHIICYRYDIASSALPSVSPMPSPPGAIYPVLSTVPPVLDTVPSVQSPHKSSPGTTTPVDMTPVEAFVAEMQQENVALLAQHAGPSAEDCRICIRADQFITLREGSWRLSPSHFSLSARGNARKTPQPGRLRRPVLRRPR